MEQIWYQDPYNFINKNNYNYFLPNKGQNFTQQLNSIFRFSIYFTIIVFILNKNTSIFFVIIFTGILTYFMYNADTNNKLNETMYLESKGQYKDKNTDEICTRPNKDNPFMNVLQSDYKYNPNKPRACNISKSDVKKEVTKMFDDRLYRDVSDVFHNQASDRQWFTNPVTTICNDSDAYSQWLYGSINNTCKGQNWNEGSGAQCYNNQYRLPGQ